MQGCELPKIHLLRSLVDTAHLGSSRRSESKVISFELLTPSPMRAECCG